MFPKHIISNTIISLGLIAVVATFGYFVLHNTKPNSNLALTSEPVVVRNDLSPAENPTSKIENQTDSSFVQNPTSKIKNQTDPSSLKSNIHNLKSGSAIGGDPLVKGGFKVLGGSSGGGGLYV